MMASTTSNSIKVKPCSCREFLLIPVWTVHKVAAHCAAEQILALSHRARERGEKGKLSAGHRQRPAGRVCSPNEKSEPRLPPPRARRSPLIGAASNIPERFAAPWAAGRAFWSRNKTDRAACP